MPEWDGHFLALKPSSTAVSRLKQVSQSRVGCIASPSPFKATVLEISIYDSMGGSAAVQTLASSMVAIVPIPFIRASLRASRPRLHRRLARVRRGNRPFRLRKRPLRPRNPPPAVKNRVSAEKTSVFPRKRVSTAKNVFFSEQDAFFRWKSRFLSATASIFRKKGTFHEKTPLFSPKNALLALESPFSGKKTDF